MTKIRAALLVPFAGAVLMAATALQVPAQFEPPGGAEGVTNENTIDILIKPPDSLGEVLFRHPDEPSAGRDLVVDYLAPGGFILDMEATDRQFQFGIGGVLRFSFGDMGDPFANYRWGTYNFSSDTFAEIQTLKLEVPDSGDADPIIHFTTTLDQIDFRPAAGGSIGFVETSRFFAVLTSLPSSPSLGDFVFLSAGGADPDMAHCLYNGTQWIKIGGTLASCS